MSIATAEEWKAFVKENPKIHLLQTPEWGMLKENFNWKVSRLIVGDVGAQILFRRIFPGITIAYIPKGPIGINWENHKSLTGPWKALSSEIDALCRRERAFLLKIEPDLWEYIERPDSSGVCMVQTQELPQPDGFQKSLHSIQPQRTIIIDLRADEDVILGRMKQKTRYNIRLARRKEIVIHPSADIRTFFRMIEETGSRDQFFVHEQKYYQMAYDLFHPAGECELLQADVQGEAIAGIMIFASGDRAWYLYGASSNQHRERMPSYLLQWEAMLWAKGRNCDEYDLWGIPDENYQYLEEQFTSRNDALWGVYRFKRGFGGELKRAAGPWDRIYNPLLYAFYNLWIKQKTPIQ